MTTTTTSLEDYHPDTCELSNQCWGASRVFLCGLVNDRNYRELFEQVSFISSVLRTEHANVEQVATEFVMHGHKPQPFTY